MQHLMDGVLLCSLPKSADNDASSRVFIASVGWVRYKPLSCTSRARAVRGVHQRHALPVGLNAA
jgi:hypothetical protein